MGEHQLNRQLCVGAAPHTGFDDQNAFVMLHQNTQSNPIGLTISIPTIYNYTNAVQTAFGSKL